MSTLVPLALMLLLVLVGVLVSYARRDNFTAGATQRDELGRPSRPHLVR